MTMLLFTLTTAVSVKISLASKVVVNPTYLGAKMSDPQDSEKARLDKLASEGQQRKASESGSSDDLEQAARMQSTADREASESDDSK